MRKYDGMREILLELLGDQRWHTMDEIEKACEEGGIHLNGNRNAIYGTIHRLKEKEVVKTSGTGQYKLSDEKTKRENKGEDSQKKEGDAVDMVEENIKNIEKYVKNYKNFDWIHCSEQELREARINVNKLVSLAEQIQNEFAGRKKK